MHALLYKDFRVMWKQMKAFLLLIAIFCLIPNQALNLSAFFVVYAGLMLPMSLPQSQVVNSQKASGIKEIHLLYRLPSCFVLILFTVLPLIWDKKKAGNLFRFPA